MRARHPALPTVWLMTDERMGDRLWPALDRLPRGAGVVFRHHATSAGERKRLMNRVHAVVRRRRLVLVVAGAGHGVGAGTHNGRGRGLRTRSAHSRVEALAAVRAGADAVFVSPVFATRSHPGARALGTVRLGMMIRDLPVPAIALGGVTKARARSLVALGVHGWAAIDAWCEPAKSRYQKRNAVPT